MWNQQSVSDFLAVVLCTLLFKYTIDKKLQLYFTLLNFTKWNCTGCPKKHGNLVTNLISSLLWISIVIPNSKSHNIIMSARVYFMKKVKDCKVVSIMSPKRWTVKTDKFTLFVYCNFLDFLSTTVCSQNINKQNVNIANETLTDCSFLSRYHYTKSKNLYINLACLFVCIQ